MSHKFTNLRGWINPQWLPNDKLKGERDKTVHPLAYNFQEKVVFEQI